MVKHFMDRHMLPVVIISLQTAAAYWALRTVNRKPENFDDSVLLIHGGTSIADLKNDSNYPTKKLYYTAIKEHIKLLS